MTFDEGIALHALRIEESFGLSAPILERPQANALMAFVGSSCESSWTLCSNEPEVNEFWTFGLAKLCESQQMNKPNIGPE